MKSLKKVLRKKMQKLGLPIEEMYQCLRRVHNYKHLQKVIKSPDNLIWDELLIRSYGKVSELNKFFKDYLIDKCKLINQDRDDKKLYDLYVLHYIEVVLYANENPDKKINLDDYLTTRDGKEYYMLMRRK